MTGWTTPIWPLAASAVGMEETAPAAPRVTSVEPPTAFCDVCGGPTLEIRCKVICKRCGYTRDCSDP